MPDSPQHIDKPEPRGQTIAAVLAVGAIYLALPRNVVVGPIWLLPTVIVVLLVPTVVSHRVGKQSLNRLLGFVINGITTLALIASVILLVRLLPTHRESPLQLLRSGGLLWLTNVIVFALWYWRLDAGGPHGRESRSGHPDGAFLFPQMTMPPEEKIAAGQHTWSPNFVDYLFIAFNTSTAFSPTDVPVLARWGKVLMMLQSIISLTVLVLLAARAVNIL